MAMEKESLNPQLALPQIQTAKKSRHNFWGPVFLIVCIVLFCLRLIPSIDLGYSSHLGPIHRNLGNGVDFLDQTHSFDGYFNWDSVNPSRELDFVPCFVGENIAFQCALLDVPMDWNAKEENEGDAKRVNLAVIRLPAPVDVTNKKYGGAVLINPGGPGGSGVLATIKMGSEIAKIINSEEKYFDIVSFDPRGVNNTKPRLSCFPDSSSSDIFRLAREIEGFGSESVGPLWSRTKALAMACAGENDPDGIIAHMNTRVVVADMVAIIEGLGQWREKEAVKILSQEEASCKDREETLLKTKWQKGKEKLLYWGFSYGTLLGATFAAMEPERVQRVILDGVVDSTDYYMNTWEKDLQDTDGIMDNLYEYCSQAGNSSCPLSTGNSTAKDIRKSLEGLMEDLKEEPLAIWTPQGPEIITYSDVISLVRPVLYSPLQLAPIISLVLADIAYGNSTLMALVKSLGHAPSCPLQCGDKRRTERECESAITVMEGTAGVMCSDGPDVSNRTLKWFKEGRKRLFGQSRWLGEAWSALPLWCVAWKGKATWQVTPDDIKGNTSHPILWIGNSLDPVTPLANAHTMAEKFPGSVVLQQDSEGHCCISSPSLCTARHIRNYFNTGELPAPGTVCQPEEKPFIGKAWRDEEMVYSTADLEIIEAMKGIGKARSNYGPLSPF